MDRQEDILFQFIEKLNQALMEFSKDYPFTITTLGCSLDNLIIVDKNGFPIRLSHAISLIKQSQNLVDKTGENYDTKI